MKLRELLKLLGMVVRVHPVLYIKAYPIDRRRDDWIEIGWSNDYEGNGPEYGYYPENSSSWDPVLFYHIPDTDEDDPQQLDGITIDWDAEDWMIDKESFAEISNGMRSIQQAFESLTEFQKCSMKGDYQNDN